MDIEMTCFQVIQYTTTARNTYLEALQEVKKGDFIACNKKLREGDEALKKAYCAHGELVHLEENGKRVQLNLLLLQAQDQVSSAELFKILCNEVVDVYRIMDTIHG